MESCLPADTSQRKRAFSEEVRALLASIVLLVVTLGVYHQVRHFDFIEDYDDGPYVTQNFHIKYDLNWQTVKWAFTSYYAGNWDPLTWLSHALDCRLYFLNSGEHHQTSVLIHGLNAVLLFWVLWRATGYLGRSFIVAALFALHPMNVESAVWIAERKNVLSMFFFLLALGAYGWYARRPSLGRYGGVVLLYACSLMSKAQIITFPFVLLLWDYWPLRRMFPGAPERFPGTRGGDVIPPRSLAWLVCEKIPLLALSATAAVLTVKANVAGGTMSGARNSYPLGLRLANAIVSYPRYLAKAIWPSHLAIVYPYPKVSVGIPAIAAAFLFLALITWAAYFIRQCARYPLVGWLWFVGTLVPMIGIVQVGSHPMADRFTYVPYIGIFVVVCWGFADLSAEMWPSRQLGHALNFRTTTLTLITVLALAALTVVTYRQIGYWKNSLTLWSHAVAVTNGNDDAEDKLGSALIAAGKEETAAAHFRNAVAINPTDPLINVHMGFIEQHDGHLQQAIYYYQQALALTQSDIVNTAALRDDALKNMGVAYRRLGDRIRADECFRAASQLEREYRQTSP